MGLFMEGRLCGIAVMVIAARGAWAGATASSALWILTLVASGRYAFLLWKTLQGAVVVPMFWRHIARLVVLRDLTHEEFFAVDAAPENIAELRKAALMRMQEAWKQRWPKANEVTTFFLKHFSDYRFKASGFESMFPIFQSVVNASLHPGTVVDHSDGAELVDIDGNRFMDASGSYGVNCFGLTRMKEFMQKGHELSQQVGPCLGPMHPVVKENIEGLLKIFRKEEVSFHMSGTEAIMCAVQQARFHTQRNMIAVFKGSYHGWWDGVMQGAGNDRFSPDLLILKENCPASLEILKLRASEIAGVIVNPISGFGWGNAKTATLGHEKVNAGVGSIERFTKWLCQLRETCTASGVPLIYDETWTFQLGPGGAQDLYGVDADLVALGKAVGGGHACGVVVGPSCLMERRDPSRPMRVSFVVGTFKGNPVVMGAMNAVLKWVTTPEAAAVFNGHRDRVATWVEQCNAKLEAESLPISVAAYRSMWCICYKNPGSYHFLFHYYLRDVGLVMCWVGTGKMLLNMEYTTQDFERLTELIVKAGRQFKADGWWWEGAKPVTTLQLLKLVVKPTLRYHFGSLLSLVGANF